MNHRVLAHVVAMVAMCALPAVAGANVAPPPPPLSTAPGLTWDVKGRVDALERQGNTVFVGGDFSYVGPPNTRLGSVISAQTAEAPLGLPRIVGSEVRAVLPDGSGGWFIGGRFTSVGGIACQNLAHVRADLTVDPAFCGTIDMGGGSSVSPVVNALAKSATTLYLGGRFARVRSSQRSNLAALTLSTGAVAGFDAGAIEWAETIPGIQGCQRECTPEVHALALDTKLFVAGNFTSIAGTTRWGLAALNPSTGGVRFAFGATPSGFNRGGSGIQEGDESEFQVPVRALALGGGRLYLGGGFDHVNGHALEGEPLHDGIAAVDAATGALVTTFAVRIPSASTGPTVKAIAVVGTTVFVGGDFSSVIQPGSGAFARSNLAAITTGGAVLPWHPDPDDDVNSIAAAPGGAAVIVGGPFTAIGGASRDRVAAVIHPVLSPQGAVTSWAPALLGSPAQVNAVAVAGDAAYVGGDFSAIGGLRRRSLAAFDLTTGRPTAWAPVPSSTSGGSSISSLARVGSTLYVGGRFDAISGVSRANLAAVATDTGAVLPWHPPDVAPGPDNHVFALAANAAAVFVGGDFIDGFAAPFDLAVALHPTTGVPLPWQGRPAGIFQSGRPSVKGMTLSGSTLFMVGNFAGPVGTVSRPGIMSVDAATGAVSPFDADMSVGGGGPPRDVAIRALTASTSRVYLVGPDARIGGQLRPDAASLDGATGALTDWAPSFSGGTASSVLLSGPDVLIGTSSGAIKSFSLDAPAVPGTFSVTGDGAIRDMVSGPGFSVIAGGSFGSIGGRDQVGLAIFVRAVPVSVGPSNAVVGKRDRWSAPVRCPRAAARRCVIDASLQETATRARGIIGRARLTVRAGRAQRAVFILTARGRGLLHRRAQVAAVVRVVATDARGTVTKGERSFALRLPSS